ncbi:asparagine synthase-related protein [Thiomicrospira sp. ALE5]|uniref:asparagine synthase-related protein n=1 Tax=Thiomicrospira sp. ALE5 TaxID=748650 RepID=UPI0008E339B6|nr:asparagine synthase-related protein [Thiomicrospira sp. ALE5]SFR49286.1 Asparagine synthase [Thiomicrospira sp. ALE5]
MPGIYGFSVTQSNPANTIEKMTDAMHLYDHFIKDTPLLDERVEASRVHLGHIGEKSSPIESDGIFVWVEGEVYNLDEIASQFDLFESTTIGDALIKTYQANQLDAFLNKLDGYFCAALYDQKSQQIKLISDRYGMRMLYWYWHQDQFAWASEVKGILALNDIDKTIDPTSFDCFMDLGYLLGEHTWFEQIKLIKPATVLTFDIQSQSIEQHYYWKWSEIKPSNMTFEQAVDELGNRFIKAVERRFAPAENIGIALSGGLDSRAIFAAVNHLYPDHKGYAYTFGIDGCDDIQIAKQVIARSNWDYQEFHFTSGNWFTPRIEKIWNTDGMQDMMHMHGSQFRDSVAEKMVINLNGYGGGLMTGELIYPQFKNHKVDAVLARKKFKKHFLLCGELDSFYDLLHIDPFIYMHRNRRFTNMGTINSLVKVENRKPIMDNDVFSLLMSLPDEYRMNNKLYSAMLQKFFPKYFKDIPWQKTGKPAGVLGKASIPKRAFNKGMRILKSVLGLKSTKGYTDYNAWIRSPEIAEQLTALFKRENSEYQKITQQDFLNDYLQPHLNNKLLDKSNQILRAATVELYLRKVNRK